MGWTIKWKLRICVASLRVIWCRALLLWTELVIKVFPEFKEKKFQHKEKETSKQTKCFYLILNIFGQIPKKFYNVLQPNPDYSL